MCVESGWPVHEVDYRLKRVRAYYKCQHALAFTSPEQLSDLNKQLIDLECTTKALASEFEDATAQTRASLIRLRDQGTLSFHVVEVFCNTIVAITDQWKDELNAWKCFDGTLLEYCQQHNCLTIEYLTKSLTFDVNLLDIRMFIQGLESSALVTIVYAGGAHCAMLKNYLGCYSPFMYITSQGVSVDYAQLTLQQPAGLSPAQATRFFTTAEKLSTTQGQELTPLNLSFLVRLANNPEAFIQELAWWRRMLCCMSAKTLSFLIG